MVGTKRLAINVTTNWAAMAINMVVPFFLMPFVVRHLGAVAYGVWILAVSTVSYLNLLDLGLRSAVVRFVSKAQARDDLSEASSAIQAALWFRLLIAAGVAVLSILLALAVPYLFKIPGSLVRAAQITTLLCALGVAVTLVAGVFGAVLAAVNRFDLLSTIAVAQTVTRAVGVLWLLEHGHGLVPLACWELTVLALIGLATVLCALKTFPAARVRLARPPAEMLRRIWSYSFTTFVFVIAVQVITNTDNLVVGAFLSVTVVAFYAIGGSLVSYAYQVSGALSTTFTPMASGFEASGRTEDLRRMLIHGTQATLALALPIAAALFFRGGTFLRLWMGAPFQGVSEGVVRILLGSMFFGVADATAGSIMMAIDRHKPVARWAVYEAVLNLVLSLILVKRIGLYGVAWGTTISMAITHLLFWPRYVGTVLHVAPKTYVTQGWLRVTACAIPFCAACMLSERYWHPQHLWTFFLQIAAILPIYLASVAVGFHRDVRSFLAQRRSAPQQIVALEAS